MGTESSEQASEGGRSAFPTDARTMRVQVRYAFPADVRTVQMQVHNAFPSDACTMHVQLPLVAVGHAYSCASLMGQWWQRVMQMLLGLCAWWQQGMRAVMLLRCDSRSCKRCQECVASSIRV